jgi:hypothetical protein
MTPAPLPAALSGHCSSGSECRDPHPGDELLALCPVEAGGGLRVLLRPHHELKAASLHSPALHGNSPRNPRLPAQRAGRNCRLCKGAGVGPSRDGLA